jgi:hypothetical protein
MPENRLRTAGLTRLTLLAAVAGTVLLAGCGDSADSGASDAAAPQSAEQNAAGDSGGGSGGGSDSAGSGVQPPAATQGSGGQKQAQSGAGGTANVAQATPRRVRTAQVTVEVTNLETTATVVRQIAADLGGIVGSETTGFGQAASQPNVPGQTAPSYVQPSAVAGEAVIVLRVPEPKLDEALLRVSRVGKELTRTSSSDDVTARLADLGSRVSSQQKSLARVRALLDQATDLNQIVSIEAELARREADLESLQAQQRALSDQADLSTLTAILRLPDAKPSTSAPEDDDENGFLKGFQAGWDALVASTTVVLTILGALLPIAIVLALVGVPLWLLVRRFRPEPRPRPAPRPRPGTAGNPYATPAPGAPAAPTAPTAPVPAGVGATQAQPAQPASPAHPADET